MNLLRDFREATQALNLYLGDLEEALSKIQEKLVPSKSSSFNPSPLNKRRKFDKKSTVKGSSSNDIDITKIINVKHWLSKDEVAHLSELNKCLSYRVTSYTKKHINVCEERKRFLARQVNGSENLSVYQILLLKFILPTFFLLTTLIRLVKSLGPRLATTMMKVSSRPSIEA